MANRLNKENSLYLRQHAENPVDWFSWGDEAFKKARDENKLLIVSIGYSSCHWCHVMEHNVFEHEDAAALMNEHFVSVKVDREERPAIDQIYMDAVQMITGSGGWPLNVFVLPDGRPFYGGTYFPKTQWMSLIERLAITYKERPELIRQTAAEIKEKIAQNEDALQGQDSLKSNNVDLHSKLSRQWKANFDSQNGGEKGAPKFPMPAKLSAVLNMAFTKENESVKKQVLFTLKKMAAGGIYDQVGGGFSRYAVDSHWKVPHFEKMLYDNAQLLPLYAKAAAIENDKLCKLVLNETFEFLLREMQPEPGLFAAAIDADSEGVEGKFYTWNYDEFKQVMPDDQWADFFNVIKPGNWEGTNVLHCNSENMDEKMQAGRKFESALAGVKSVFLQEREKRIRPIRDDKAITSWNAMLAFSLLEANRYVSNENFYSTAIEILNPIKAYWQKHQQLPRILNYDAGEGMLDDYAYVAKAFYGAHEITHEQSWLELAENILVKTLELFDLGKPLLNYYPVKNELFATKTEWLDTVIPSSNALVASALFNVGYAAKNPEFTEKSMVMVDLMKPYMEKHPLMLGAWIEVNLDIEEKQFVSIGDKYDSMEVRNNFAKEKYFPDILPLTMGEKDDMLVCKGSVCFQPVKSVQEAKQLLK